MADSDDEYDRKRRDKFRGERAEPYRGSERQVRPRDDWPERDNWSRPRPRDYPGRVRDRGYSPSIEPALKRQRSDYYGGGDNYFNHYTPYHQAQHRREAPAAATPEGQQPPMMSFKSFLATQDDNISDSEAIEKYNDYKLEFQRQQLNEFFVAHKDDEWFRIKYHPEDSTKRKEEQQNFLKKRVEVFMELLNDGKLEKTLDVVNTNCLTKLLDTVVIKLEGGTEEDFAVLDKEYEEKEDQLKTKDPQTDDDKKKDKEQSAASTTSTATGAGEDGEIVTEAVKEDGESKTNGAATGENNEDQNKESGELNEDEPMTATKTEVAEEKVEEAVDGKGEEDEERMKKKEEEVREEEQREEDEVKSEKMEVGGDDVEEVKEKEVEREEGDEKGEKDEKETEKEESPKPTKEKKRKRSRSYSGSSSSSSSSSSSDSDDDKDEDEETTKDAKASVEKKEEGGEDTAAAGGGGGGGGGGEKKTDDDTEDKCEKAEIVEDEEVTAIVTEEKETKTGPLHKTTSIFLRSLAPTITRQEVEAMCARYDGFLRVAIADPQQERRWLRRAWVSFRRDANIKEICWSLNNIRLRDCELGAIMNRDLTRRIRAVTGIVAHRQIVRSDIRIGARVILHMDSKAGLWPDDDDSKVKAQQTFGFVSNNPILHNITDYLIEEASAEEEELLGLEPSSDNLDSTAVVDRDDSLITVLDRIILYLRIVHSLDYYNHCEYPNEDEMPSRCGILHARGPPPTIKTDITPFIGAPIETKMANFLPEKNPEKPDANKNEVKLINLSLKNVSVEIDKFVQANTRELAKDKWLCPLSGKKFKGPDFVRKHIFNKHAEKIEEVKKEVEFFNNYLKDLKRPMLAETPQAKREEQPNSYNNHQSSYGGGGGGYGGGGGMGGYGNMPRYYNQGYARPHRGYSHRARGGGGASSSEFRPVIHYRDLDAPREPEEFI